MQWREHTLCQKLSSSALSAIIYSLSSHRVQDAEAGAEGGRCTVNTVLPEQCPGHGEPI